MPKGRPVNIHEIVSTRRGAKRDGREYIVADVISFDGQPETVEISIWMTSFRFQSDEPKRAARVVAITDAFTVAWLKTPGPSRYDEAAGRWVRLTPAEVVELEGAAA